jgi:hypothetical protein
MRNAHLFLALLVSTLSTTVAAQETAAPAPAEIASTAPTGSRKQYPALGGHLGFALPILTISDQTTTIGSDFVTVGITPGLTVHLDEKWAVDFEFIAFNDFKNNGATTLVVDPGVIRKFDNFVVGLRVASRVGNPPNVGIVPIFVVPFRISETLVYFVEADIPVFFTDIGSDVRTSGTFLFQSGFGF